MDARALIGKFRNRLTSASLCAAMWLSLSENRGMTRAAREEALIGGLLVALCRQWRAR